MSTHLSPTGGDDLDQADRTRTADVVYHELLSRLVTGDIAPDQRISVDGMSRELGVSQTPVREALALLEAKRLVTRVHLAGFRAAPLLTETEFEKLFEARLLIEPHLAELAATRHTDEQSIAMTQAAERMRQQAEKIELLSYGEFADEDAWLHDLIADAAENPLLREALAGLHAHVHLFRLHYDTAVSEDAIGEHDDILLAIGERRPTAAASAMRAHLRASRARLLAAFR